MLFGLAMSSTWNVLDFVPDSSHVYTEVYRPQTTWGYDGANVSGWRGDDLILIDKVRLRLWRRRILSAIPKSRSLADVWDEDERGGAKLGINAGGAKAGNDFSCDVDSTHTSHCDFQIAVNQSLNSIALCVHCDIGIGFVELPYAR